MALMDSSSRAMSGREVDLKAATAVTNATDAALKDLLGPGRYGQYQDFEKTLGMRVQVQQFNRQLAEEGVPLDDSQSAALIRIMSEEAAAAPPGFGLGGGMDMSAGDIDQYSQRVEAVNHRVYTRAESVLTPTQLSAFAAFQKNSETTQVAGLRMAEQMLK